MKLGVALGALNAHFHLDAALAAEALGYESVWLPEHLVLPVRMSRSPRAGEDHPPIPPTTPVFDAPVSLAHLAGRCPTLRLGTHVYNLALRHPFVAARALLTLDVVSGGRVEAGIGAGWLEEEWDAAGIDFHTRGRRLDEAITICRRLWTEPEVEHHGDLFSFDAVAFEPKPVQPGGPPILVGGESDAALRRAARLGDGWVGMGHTVDTVAAPIARLRALLAEKGRADEPFQVVVGATVERPEDLERWADVGVTRLIVAPWRRSPEAVDALAALADQVGLVPR